MEITKRIQDMCAAYFRLTRYARDQEELRLAPGKKSNRGSLNTHSLSIYTSCYGSYNPNTFTLPEFNQTAGWDEFFIKNRFYVAQTSRSEIL
jgi:hypothetical protein